MLSAKRMSFVKEHFYLRRRHTASITAKLDSKYFDTIKISNLLIDIFKRYGFYDRFKKKLLNNRIFYLSRWFNEIDDEFRIEYWERLHTLFKDIPKDKNVYEEYINNLTPANKQFFLDAVNLDCCHANDLIISSKFLPLNDVSGVVLSKRVLNSNKTYDVIQADVSGPKDEDFNNVIEKFIDNRIIIKNIGVPNTVEGIVNFRRKGMEALEKNNKKYKSIFSRSWTIESHILALDYKLKYKDTFWTAEFSDPLLFDMNNKERGVGNNIVIKDENYLNKINNEIINFNKSPIFKKYDLELPLIKNTDSIYFIAEYLSFIFADKIRFTNENQRKIMLNQFPVDIKDFVMGKSEVKHHPVIDEKYYHLKELDYEVDSNYLNIAYFGTYYGKRHLEYIFYAFELLPKEVRDKIKFHFFVPNTEYLKEITKNLKISENIIIGPIVPLLEFLNLTTKLDVLIVNDTLTNDCFDVNPYLPSKLADYLGSGTDIWGICEEGSILSKSDIKYKSNILEYKSSKDVLIQIIKDKLNMALNIDDEFENEFLSSRCTFFNDLADDLNKNRTYFISHSKNLSSSLSTIRKELGQNKALVTKYESEISELKNTINNLNEELSDKSSQIELVKKAEEFDLLKVRYNNLLKKSEEFDLLKQNYVKVINKNFMLKNEINEYNIKLKNLEKNLIKKSFNNE